MNWPFGDLKPFHYGMILADPPWRFANYSAKGEVKNPVAHYDIIASAPAYQGKTYTVLAASAEWGIGQANEWYGDYVIQSVTGEKSVARQSSLVLVAA